MKNKDNRMVSSENDIHKTSAAPLPKEGAYIVGEIEDVLTPISPDTKQEGIYKGRNFTRLLRDQDVKIKVFSASKKIQPKKHKARKKRLFTFAIILVLGVISGSLLGGWYKDFIKPKEVTWPEESEIRDTEEEVLTALNAKAGTSASDFPAWMSVAREKGITPKDLSASQNFMLADFNGSQASSFDVVSHGKVATIATQSVYSRKAYNGDKYTFESISKGLLTIATCSVMEYGSSSVDLFQGNNVQDEGADWTGKKTTYTTAEFYDYAGCTPNVLIPYIISSKTILDEDKVTIEETTYKDIPVYKYTVQLKTEASELYYVREVKQKSGLDNYPEFFDITYTIMIDENWNFVHTEVLENYKVVAFKAPATCQGTMSSDYYFNQPVTLPV